MKPVNLLSLVNAKHDLSPSVFEQYVHNFDIKIKEDEIKDMESLIKQLQNHVQNIAIFDGFYVGYTIRQISKEFDLLRFGKESIINIELKRENTGERIKKQLSENQYYLSFLKKELFSFTYVAEEQKLFYLHDSKMLVETDFAFLISKLREQVVEVVEDINKLFDPVNYLVSPFNATEAFMNGRYFLTDHQKEIKREILKLNAKTGPCFTSIQGSAGTGKTLLTYDIAKEYIKAFNHVLILHCGGLNNGHNKLREDYSWSIAAMKDHDSYDLSKYHLVIIDEAQRMYKGQLDKFLSNIMETNTKCIFSYDPQQCLSSGEVKRNIPQYITDQVSPQSFKLTEKIRVSKEIGAFIKNLFDLAKKNPNQAYPNVHIHYFSNAYNAKAYVNLLKKQGWKAINYTPSNYDNYAHNQYQNSREDNAHEVIGLEYDCVIAVLDRHFYYNQAGKLATRDWYETPYYNPTRMLFQIVTRTRKKLSVIIINNEAVLHQCLKILHS